MINVSNFKSNRTGRSIANQFIITADGAEVFQSYETVIAKRLRDGKILLDAKAWDYSMTTGKYRNQFLGETKKETEKKIKQGIYELVDLNS